MVEIWLHYIVDPKLNGTRQLLAYADVNLLGVNIDTIKKTRKLK
jgi:hypothetical protein